MTGKVYLNGCIVEPEQATISVFDRGFLYGDSIFETMRVYANIPFALEAHLERFYASGTLVGFDVPWDRNTLRAAIVELINAANMPDAYLRMIGTRGSGPLGLDPRLASLPQLIILILPLPMVDPRLYRDGGSAVFVSILKNLKKTVDPRAKTGNYLGNIMAVQEAKQSGCDEAIMLDVEGRVAEASAANVFALIDGVWCTPTIDTGILSGITRSTILEICSANGIAYRECELWPQDFEQATEVFICASVREIIPITRLDGHAVGTGAVGASTMRLRELYHSRVMVTC